MAFWRGRQSFSVFCFFALLGAVLAIFYACEDFGIEADFFKGTIKGEVRLHQPVPSNTDEIRVAVSKTFPPADILSLIFSGPLPVNKDSTLTEQTIPYDIQVPLDDYAAVFSIWKEKDKSFNPADIIGLYGDLQFRQPVTVSLSDEHPVADSVDMDIDFARVLRNSKIEGKITFVGEWPANTGAVAIFVFPIIPRVFPDDFLTFAAFEILPKDVEEFDYRLRISPGNYKFIAVFWQAQGAPLTEFQTIGVYRDPDAPAQPGEVTVAKDATVTGIDIVADFANIR